MPGTEVVLADGTGKPIDEVSSGDLVMATDPATGKTEVKPVTATIEGDGVKVLVDVTVDDGNSTGTVTATNGHPFWLPDRAEWLKAIELRPGDSLISPDGSRVSVLAVAVYAAPATVHNLTVANIHTYYVFAGKTPVLVHNCGTGGGSGGGRHRSEETVPDHDHDGQHYARSHRRKTVGQRAMAWFMSRDVATNVATSGNAGELADVTGRMMGGALGTFGPVRGFVGGVAGRVIGFVWGGGLRRGHGPDGPRPFFYRGGHRG